MDVALGGTFDPIHDGHRALFSAAFERGDVIVGLTTDGLAAQTRQVERSVRSYEARREALDDELASFATEYDRDYAIEPLATPTGIASERPELTYLVVTPETAATADVINERRRDQGFEPLEIIVVDKIPADDGGIISSTRILRGEIDEHGRVTEE